MHRNRDQPAHYSRVDAGLIGVLDELAVLLADGLRARQGRHAVVQQVREPPDSVGELRGAARAEQHFGCALDTLTQVVHREGIALDGADHVLAGRGREKGGGRRRRGHAACSTASH